MTDFNEDCRSAATTTLGAYASAASVDLNVYRGRPRSIKAPHAFVDRVSESVTYAAGTMMARTVSVEIVVLWGLFDSGEAVDQRDAFVDGYVAYLRSVQFTAAGPNATFAVVSSEDDPVFIPDWIAPSERNATAYFATRIVVEGYTGD